MPFKSRLLSSDTAVQTKYKAGDYLFQENGNSQFYYYILAGTVKLNNYDEDGKEFIQDILYEGANIGVSMLLLGRPYPVNAVAMEHSIILKMSRDHFMDLVNSNLDSAYDLCLSLSENTYNKFLLLRNRSNKSATKRIIEILDLLKSQQKDQARFAFEIPHTRQQLAALAGLCLETTIRTVKKLERDKILIIKNRKVFY